MVNVTILVHNRLKLTQQAIASLVPSTVATRPREAFDKITLAVLDDNSDRETKDYFLFLGGSCWKSYQGMEYQPWTEKYMFVRNDVSWGTGAARNQIIRASENRFGRGDYLYLSDNDVFFKPGWLGYLIKAYEFAWDHGYRVLGAYNHPFHQPVSRLPITKGSYTILNVDQVHALALQSMLMRWEVWDKYGPFCKTEPGRVCQSEDVEFTNKIVADGFKLGVVSPALIVNTGITNSFGEKIPGWELVKAQCPEGVICL